jgi:hypothetical protein
MVWVLALGGAAAGGIGGALIGGGLGALGFNMVTDTAVDSAQDLKAAYNGVPNTLPQETKAPSQYLKDFAYGLPLDALLGGPYVGNSH